MEEALDLSFDRLLMMMTCYSCQILVTPEFSQQTQISHFLKIRPVKIELFYVDGRTDGRPSRRVEANIRSWQLCERLPPQKKTVS